MASAKETIDGVRALVQAPETKETLRLAAAAVSGPTRHWSRSICDP